MASIRKIKKMAKRVARKKGFMIQIKITSPQNRRKSPGHQKRRAIIRAYYYKKRQSLLYKCYM